MKDYYQILGIERQAADSDIRKAYRRLVRMYHPDINPAREAHAKFLEVQEAYEVLMDSEKRTHYDTWGNARPVFEAYQAPAEDPKEAQRREYRKWRAARDREQELERAILEYKYRKVLRWINLAVATITFLMLLDFLLPPKVDVVRGMNYYKEESGRVYYTQDYIYAEMGPYHFMVPYRLFRQYENEAVEVHLSAVFKAPFSAQCTLDDGTRYEMDITVVAAMGGHFVLWVMLICSMATFLDTSHTEVTHILGYFSLLGLLVTGIQLVSVLIG